MSDTSAITVDELEAAAQAAADHVATESGEPEVSWVQLDAEGRDEVRGTARVVLEAAARVRPPVLAALVVQPGDRILVGLDGSHDADELADYATALRRTWPDVTAVFVDGVTNVTVYRDQDGADRG